MVISLNQGPQWIVPNLLARSLMACPLIGSPLNQSPSHFYPADLIGSSFLMDKQEDGLQFRGHIVELLEDHASKLEDNPTRIKFRISVNEDQAEEIITYNKMLEYIRC
jgi:hypothetical protein